MAYLRIIVTQSCNFFLLEQFFLPTHLLFTGIKKYLYLQIQKNVNSVDATAE
jgi:hypothetical protein